MTDTPAARRDDPSPPCEPADADVCAIVVAAGRGARMGAMHNKLLLPLLGEPVLFHTLRALTQRARVGALVLVTRPDERAQIAAIAAAATRARIPVHFADGGAERADSVQSGVRALPAHTSIALIHDGARPFVGDRVLCDVIAATRRHGAAIPTLPLVETVKRVSGECVVETLDRSTLHAAQTPQGFRARDLLAVVQHATLPHGCAPTDDAALFEGAGRTVHVVAGDPFNVKITRPADLELAELLLALFQRREEMP